MLALLLLLLAAPPATERVALEYALTASADLVATEWALSANPRAYEINPLMQTRGRRLLTKTVQVGALTFVSHKLKRRKPRLERALRWTAHGVNVGLGVWALRQGARKQGP